MYCREKRLAADKTETFFVRPDETEMRYDIGCNHLGENYVHGG